MLFFFVREPTAACMYTFVYNPDSCVCVHEHSHFHSQKIFSIQISHTQKRLPKKAKKTCMKSTRTYTFTHTHTCRQFMTVGNVAASALFQFDKREEKKRRTRRSSNLKSWREKMKSREHMRANTHVTSDSGIAKRSKQVKTRENVYYYGNVM